MLRLSFQSGFLNDANLVEPDLENTEQFVSLAEIGVDRAENEPSKCSHLEAGSIWERCNGHHVPVVVGVDRPVRFNFVLRDEAIDERLNPSERNPPEVSHAGQLVKRTLPIAGHQGDKRRGQQREALPQQDRAAATPTYAMQQPLTVGDLPPTEAQQLQNPWGDEQKQQMQQSFKDAELREPNKSADILQEQVLPKHHEDQQAPAWVATLPQQQLQQHGLQQQHHHHQQQLPHHLYLEDNRNTRRPPDDKAAGG